MKRYLKKTMVVGAVATLALAGCAGETNGPGPGGLKPPTIPALTSLGAGEGAVNIVSWAGYVEDGSTDPAVDWVSDFEAATGCQVNNKVAGTSDEMVTLMQSGDYDVVSASGDASLRLIYGGDVAPVNTSLIPNYADVFEGLKLKPWNSVNGVSYGMPHGRGANLLMYRTDIVTPAPTSWGAVFDPNSPYAGKVTAYDSPIYIADAALYLMKTKPELGITNPYALDQTQLNAAKVYKKPIVTKVGPLAAFYAAEDYHQDYLTLHPTQPYIVFNDIPKVENLKKIFAEHYIEKPTLVSNAKATN